MTIAYLFEFTLTYRLDTFFDTAQVGFNKDGCASAAFQTRNLLAGRELQKYVFKKINLKQTL
jgi:hypothetical protein